MTNENRIEVEEKTCFCQSKGFRKFLTIALGTFVGVFCALSLFAALHKPPVMKPMPFGGPMMRPCHCQMHHCHRHGCHRGNFHRKIEKRDFQQRPQIKTEK